MTDPTGSALLARIKELEEVCYAAYQIVGTLLSDTNQFDTEHGNKILDNLSEGKMVHGVLPWSSAENRIKELEEALLLISEFKASADKTLLLIQHSAIKTIALKALSNDQ